MPLMGSLYIGKSGLQTGQNALNTTAHNMSNADTTGYVRQQVLLGTSISNLSCFGICNTESDLLIGNCFKIHLDRVID